jgi:hypothetical protein
VGRRCGIEKSRVFPIKNDLLGSLFFSILYRNEVHEVRLETSATKHVPDSRDFLTFR